MKDEIRINETIRAHELRVIDEEAGNLGVLTRDDALAKAREFGLDLIEISPNAVPPVAKIMDFGKYQYQQKKKRRGSQAKTHTTETKSLQVKIGTGEHDLELKAQKASEFLKEGHRVKVDLYLRGRAKYMQAGFHQERLDRILRLLTEPYKIADGPKKSPKGLTVIIERDRAKKDENKQDILQKN
ncbi:MAG: translation initiation factor IF-3 [Candidatus Vogelbacteria bacterium]|nr:translation initiation factor IF-3 [Candidatus Vogelbacteria bacterium]